MCGQVVVLGNGLSDRGCNVFNGLIPARRQEMTINLGDDG